MRQDDSVRLGRSPGRAVKPGSAVYDSALVAHYRRASSNDVPTRGGNTAMAARFTGVFPVAPTIFDAQGALDLDGQRRCIDFLVDSGSSGICILANYSEQFALTDEEREVLTGAILRQVAGRLPVILTTTHFTSRPPPDR